METSEKIKRGLECARNCSENDLGCRKCPYLGDNCCDLHPDALAYIRQLEREKEALIGMVRESRYVCDYCKRYEGGCTKPAAEVCLDGRCFEWRGVEDSE